MGSTSADRLDRSVARPPLPVTTPARSGLLGRVAAGGEHGAAHRLHRRRADGPRHGQEHRREGLRAHRAGAPQSGADRGPAGARRHRGEEPGRHRAGQRRPDPVRAVLGRGRGVRVRRERHPGRRARWPDRDRLHHRRARLDRAGGQGARRQERALRRCAADPLAQGRRGRPAQHPGRRGRRHARRDPARARDLLRERLPRRAGRLRAHSSS